MDMGTPRSVQHVVLYNRNDCCPERLQGISIYLGSSWSSYGGNTLVSSGVNVPAASPLTVYIAATGQYLWVVRPGGDWLTLCAIQIFVGGVRRYLHIFRLQGAVAWVSGLSLCCTPFGIWGIHSCPSNWRGHA